jgi:hypothetical protein
MRYGIWIFLMGVRHQYYPDGVGSIGGSVMKTVNKRNNAIKTMLCCFALALLFGG